jgi:uncharacterized protein (DUF2236 family)
LTEVVNMNATGSTSSITPQTIVFQCHRDAVRARLARSAHVRAGRGSVSWKLNREIIVIAGWGRAILLQLAHPSVAAGVGDHSSFNGCPISGFRRLRSTVGAMLSLTFGDTDEMIAAAAGINVIHDRVRGTDRTGAVYSAHDPALLTWVHATLVESIPLTYEMLVGPLTLRERDRYAAEAAIMEPLLGIPAGRLPRDAADLDIYMRDMLDSGTLVVTDASRTLARSILFPPKWFLLWPAFRAFQLITIGSLPPSIRDAYGFEWRARDARALRRWTIVIRAMLKALPRFAREWPVARRRDRSAGFSMPRKDATLANHL